MLKYFLQSCLNNCTKKSIQGVDLLNTELGLRGLNYQTPFYADCILKCPENCHKIYVLFDNSCSFKVILNNDISKQIYKGEK
jgi:hypothetical protein